MDMSESVLSVLAGFNGHVGVPLGRATWNE